MGKIITQCPSCSSSQVVVSKIECGNCHTLFEGKFDIPLLDKLSEADLTFIINFVKCSGSLKEMAAQHGVSYPTLRNRLNELIEALEKLEQARASSKYEILTMLENGKITPKEAVNLLKKC